MAWSTEKLALRATLIALALFVTWQQSQAASLADRLKERHAQQLRQAPSDQAQVIRDVPYGHDRKQRFDVYLPKQAAHAPVIFMVHGGGWRHGDKAHDAFVESKVARWVPQGFIVISANYRMLPEANPIEQARDVARALAVAQEKAAAWGGDRNRFILLGHSAGAHLAALITTSPSFAAEAGATLPLGTVALDSAALDVVRIMESRHLPLYDQAFGQDPAFWKAASPLHALSQASPPILAVCSTRRADACPQAHQLVAKATLLGMEASVLPQDLSHREINVKLGEDNRYTEAVEAFLRGLDRSLARTLASR